MTYIAVLTTAGLIAAVALKQTNDLRRLRAATIATHPVYQHVDRIR